jgi:hypothetical protein
MLITDETLEPQVSTAANSIDPQSASPTPGQGIEPEMNSLSSQILGVAPQPANRAHGGSVRFALPPWHKPYGEALLEDDPGKLPAAIAAAERAIIARYLELSASTILADERLDLRYAVDVLSELKSHGPTKKCTPETWSEK